MDRRAQLKKAEERRLQDEADAKAARKRHRAMLREKRRIELLTNQIMETNIKEAQPKEATDIPNLPVFDIRDHQSLAEPCIVCIGGMVGELIISFTCMLEYIQSTPELSGFRFRPDMLEKFIKEVLVPEYPGVICDVKLTASLAELHGGEVPNIAEAVQLLMDAQNVCNFGLKFLLQWRKDLFLSDELIKTVLHAICAVVLQQPEEPKAELAGDDIVEEDEDPAEKLKEINEKITKDNEILNAAKAKVFIDVIKEEEVYNDEAEVALLKLNNVHEPVFDAENKPTPLPVDENGEPVIPEFKAANLPTKIPLVNTKLAAKEDGSVPLLALYHSEATFFVRR